MSFSLRKFAALLEERGELHRVPVEVDPDLEIAAVTARVCREPLGGRALFFESVRGSSFPVLTNLFGSPSRTALALGAATLEDLRSRMERILGERDADPADILLERLSEYPPALVSDGACREVVETSPDMTCLPFLRGAEGDGGSYLTLPMVFTADPLNGRRNCGMYRVQLLDRQRLAIAWRRGSGGERHSMAGAPVAVVLGGDTAAMFAAAFSFPEEADEMAFAGMLCGEPLQVLRCLRSDLLVPADAEVVIEGVLEGETVAEGPFANHTGFYPPRREAAIMKVTSVTRRSTPLIPATVVGRPPMEDCWMAKGWERLLLPYLRRRFPEITEMNFPLESIFHRVCFVSVRRGTDGEELLARLKNAPELSGARLLVAVDDDIDVHDGHGVYWRSVNAAGWEGVLAVPGGTVTLDATAKNRPLAAEPASVASLVERRWRSYGF